MKINLPREDSLPTEDKPKSPKKKLSTTWSDFAELGLRSPREIRRRMREENGADDIVSYHRSVVFIVYEKREEILSDRIKYVPNM